MKNILLLTGEPKIGKTTALMKIISLVGEENCGGFFTEEVRNESGRIGFKVRTINGQEGMIADVNSTSTLRVGKYGVNLDVFENVGIKSIYDALKDKKYVIIDEIGPMQLFSEPFKCALLEAVKSSKTIIGTIVFRPYEWADDFKLRENVQLLELSMDNRDDVPSNVQEMLMKE